jgi:hypothetical protein
MQNLRFQEDQKQNGYAQIPAPSSINDKKGQRVKFNAMSVSPDPLIQKNHRENDSFFNKQAGGIPEEVPPSDKGGIFQFN